MNSFTDIEQAAHESAYGHNSLPEPTTAMQDAGNYRKGRAKVRGIPVVIENPRGSLRQWRASDGTSGANLMKFHYGYFEGVKGADGDELDCYVGPIPESNMAYVINQNVRGAFDEHKVMLGFPDQRTAEAGYLSNFTSGWPGLQSCVPCSITQLKWWMANGDLSKPLTPDKLPYDGRNDMEKVLWDSAHQPRGTTIGKLLYDIRAHDARDGLMFDPVTVADILADADSVLALDALVIQYAKLEPRMAILKKVMDRAVDGLSVVAKQVTEPFTQKGTTNIAVVFELSDGQTLAIFFHNPDTTPKKIMPGDDVISWKWLLNKKDITIAVAPERGRDLNVRTVAMRVMMLAAKNSARFAAANSRRADRMQSIDSLKQEFAEKEKTLDALTTEIGELEKTLAAKPKVFEPKPIVEPAPVVAAAPVVDPTPVVEPVPVVEPQRAVDPDPVIDPAPVVDPQPIVDPDPVVEAAPVIQPEPDPVIVPPVEPDPVIEPQAVVEPAPVVTALSDEQQAALEAQSNALRDELGALTDDQLALVASTSPLSIPNAGSKFRDDLMTRILSEHPDDIAAALARWREIAAPTETPAQQTPDVTYRAVDEMFTAFYAETPAGREAWNRIAEMTEGTGKVLNQQVEGTVQQLREAGYTVAEAPAPSASDDDLLAALSADPDPVPAPDPEPAPTVPTVPDDVRKSVEFALETLREIRAGVDAAATLEKTIGGKGRYQADALINRKADIERAQRKLAQFRARAPENGVDAEAFINELGGEPDLTPSAEAAEWMKPKEPEQPAPVAVVDPIPEPDPEPVPAAVEPEQTTDEPRDATLAYLRSVVDGSRDLADASIPGDLKGMYETYKADPEFMDLFKQAANAYKQFALAKARTVIQAA